MGIHHRIYNFLKNLAETAGFNLVVTRRLVNSKGYESLLPSATYAPWIVDKEFSGVHEKVNGHTLVDKYRCYELWELVGETSKLNGALMEVGTWRGGSGAIIAKKAQLLGVKDNVYLCDTFKGIVKAGEHDSMYEGGELSDTSVKKVKKLILMLKLQNIKVLEGIFPDKTGKMLVDEKIRFCHIDVDVYQSAKDIVEWVWPRLVVGGIIVFDDYGFEGCEGVTLYVNEQRKKKDRLTLYNLNGHAIMIKLNV